MPTSTRWGTLVGALILGLVAAACGGSSTSTSSAPASTPVPTPSPIVLTATATVGTASQTVLTDTRGFTLYYLTTDKGER
jgi:predicted lipoprotein with Yx(FWY)xxD motif